MNNSDHPIFVTHASEVDLEDDGDGTASLVLGATGDREVGIWEIAPGVAHDVEVDEVFVVLSGSATITVEGVRDVRIGPGDVVHLTEGTPTTWTVHERLRKVYLIAREA